MKNWLIPMAVLGVSGLGLLCASDRGREHVGHLLDRLLEHGDPLSEFNKFVDGQLTAIQQVLDSLAKALEEPQA